MRRLILLLILLNLASFTFAEEIKFNDVPENHWAQKAVNDLIKAGVTTGYPDNTYRGLKNMTREEMAVFISNLAHKVGTAEGIEKLGAEIKNEYANLKYEAENPDHPIISGQYSQFIYYGNPTTRSEKGIKLDYRLKLSLYEKLSQTGSIKAGIDTIDSGLSSTPSDLLNKFFDIDGRLKLGNVNYKLTVGPGDIIHRELDNMNYSEDGKIISRPKTGLVAQTYFQNLDLAVGFRGYNIDPSGISSLREVFSRIAYTHPGFPIFGKTTLSFTPHHYESVSSSDPLNELSILSSPSKILDTELAFGFGGLETSSRTFIKASAQIETATSNIIFSVAKASLGFRRSIDRYSLIYLNAFDKMVLDGSTDIGLSIDRQLNKTLSLSLKADGVLSSDYKMDKTHAGTTFTSQIGINFALSQSINILTCYRVFCVPSKVSSIDPALAISVPELSDCFAISVKMML